MRSCAFLYFTAHSSCSLKSCSFDSIIPSIFYHLFDLARESFGLGGVIRGVRGVMRGIRGVIRGVRGEMRGGFGVIRGGLAPDIAHSFYLLGLAVFTVHY